MSSLEPPKPTCEVCGSTGPHDRYCPRQPGAFPAAAPRELHIGSPMHYTTVLDASTFVVVCSCGALFGSTVDDQHAQSLHLAHAAEEARS